MSFDLFGVVVLLKLGRNIYSLLGKGIVSNISTLSGMLVEAQFRGTVVTRAFYT